MRKLIFTVVLVLITIILARAITLADTVKCGSGNYDAGGFCKAEPTGCPYGDSISLDMCDKFAPVQEPAPEPTITPVPETVDPWSGGGK
jgi:hypothetical protein